MENNDEVLKFYDEGNEINRLRRGLGIIEFYRTKEIINRYLKGENYVIYDIGGAIGEYSSYFAKKNNEVHLLDLSPLEIKYAKEHMDKTHPYSAEVCDARALNKEDESCDVVLLMGPMYHLQNKEDRNLVLKEAYRVLKKGGLLFTAAISKYSTTTWALSTYGKDNNFIDDDIFMNMLNNELTSGMHIRPEKYKYFLTKAYLHTPQNLKSEIEEAGFKTLQNYAVEGLIWFTPLLNEKWNDEKSRENLLKILKATECDIDVMGMSPHFMNVARK